MTRFLLSMTVLVVMSLACAVPVGAPPTPSLIPATPTRRAVPSATAEDVQSVTIAVVRQPVVNVRKAADGDPTGEYVTAGQEVTVLEIEGDWVRIENPAGWIFIGCLRDLSEKGCIAE
jgi:hypothetical protein